MSSFQIDLPEELQFLQCPMTSEDSGNVDEGLPKESRLAQILAKEEAKNQTAKLNSADPTGVEVTKQSLNDASRRRGGKRRALEIVDPRSGNVVLPPAAKPDTTLNPFAQPFTVPVNQGAKPEPMNVVSNMMPPYIHVGDHDASISHDASIYPVGPPVVQPGFLFLPDQPTYPAQPLVHPNGRSPGPTFNLPTYAVPHSSNPAQYQMPNNMQKREKSVLKIVDPKAKERMPFPVSNGRAQHPLPIRHPIRIVDPESGLVISSH
eukprot:NODE_839_length_1306_cov_52.376293_g616_i0.p1 GENE.NODE_839_length_1306_cov_52.376293_g616_i0~~NODE_839_length_1306_cov_52.376293_g616_i0.p1  ORF type:complete len:281 (+),score=83.89 NODE_839_length_1306_cov_52.376293_g616_i0:56-844(+)